MLSAGALSRYLRLTKVRPNSDDRDEVSRGWIVDDDREQEL